MKRTEMVLTGAMLLWTTAAAAVAGVPVTDYRRCEQLQDRFNAARARQDAQAMAAVFAQDAVRVTPDGVFKGRDAIRQNLQNLVTAGLRDFTSKRTVSLHQGRLLLDAGEWHARLGHIQLRGYYSALLSCGPHPEILEETTNVAAPPRR